MKKRIVLAAAVAISAFAPLGAEVTVRQGTPTVQQFQSPMILEVPLPSPVDLPGGGSRSTAPNLSAFACDGVTISSLSVVLSRRNSRRGPEPLVLEVSGTLHVPPSHDRLVDLSLAVKEEETVVGRGERRKIDAEEDNQKKFKVQVNLDQAAFEEAFATDPPPRLEITLTVTSNG
jgi:hypothetical protein